MALSAVAQGREAWSREASLLRAAKLTRAIFESSRGPDVSRPWVPETLVPLFGSKSFGRLSSSQRLRYNHAYARQLLAEFVWLERSMILSPLVTLGGMSNLDPDVALVLRSFISDETQHIECFSWLERLATDADGRSSIVPLFHPPKALRALAALASRYPGTLTFWTTVIEAFEGHAIKIGQAYKRDTAVDPLFQEVFVVHARDEARHCRLDGMLTDWLRAGANARWNAFNERLAARFQTQYRSVDWGLGEPIRELVRIHPELASETATMIAEAEALRRSGPPQIPTE